MLQLAGRGLLSEKGCGVSFHNIWFRDKDLENDNILGVQVPWGILDEQELRGTVLLAMVGYGTKGKAAARAGLINTFERLHNTKKNRICRLVQIAREEAGLPR